MFSPSRRWRALPRNGVRHENRLLRFGAGVAHVEDDLPASVFLLLPDAGVLAVFDDRLAFFIFRVELIVAVGVAKIAGGGDIGADRSPEEAVVLVVEESHALGDLRFALDQGRA